MKKLLLFVAAFVFVFSVACADLDLSSLDFDELTKTNRSIVHEIMNRPEWKETKIPSGEWIVGDDFPEGTYSISAPMHMAIVTVYKTKEKTIGDLVGEFIIYEDDPLGRIILLDGYYVRFSQSVVLSPPREIEF